MCELWRESQGETIHRVKVALWRSSRELFSAILSSFANTERSLKDHLQAVCWLKRSSKRLIATRCDFRKSMLCVLFSQFRVHIKNDNLNVTIRHQLSFSSLFVFDSASRHVAAFNVLKSLFWIEHLVHSWIELCSGLNGHESVLIELWFHSEHKKL